MKKKFDKKKLFTAFWLFLLAIAFWLIIKINKEYDYAVDIPLRITINNPAICLKYPTHDSVRVQFAGRGTDLLQLQFSDVSYDIDLSDEKRDFVMNLTDMMEYVRIPVEVNVEARAIIRPPRDRFRAR